MRSWPAMKEISRGMRRLSQAKAMASSIERSELGLSNRGMVVEEPLSNEQDQLSWTAEQCT
jgi:hypothetical protein